MPYTPSQCRKFATMKNPPKDWKKHCRKNSSGKGKGKKR